MVIQIGFFSLVTTITNMAKYFYIKLSQFPNYLNWNVVQCVYIHIVSQSYFLTEPKLNIFITVGMQTL